MDDNDASEVRGLETVPGGQDFVSHIASLVENLSNLLGWDGTQLDYSAESVERLEKIVRDKFPPPARIRREVFWPVLAYVGEVIRRRGDGQWQMHPVVESDTGVLWNPLVVLASGE